YGGMQPESPEREDLDGVSHHRHAMQGRLPVEEDDVAIHQVPFYDEACSYRVSQRLPIACEVEPDLDPVRADDVVGSGVVEWALDDQALQRLDVPRGHLLRDCELLRYLERDPNLADVQARVRADDGAAR